MEERIEQRINKIFSKIVTNNKYNENIYETLKNSTDFSILENYIYTKDDKVYNEALDNINNLLEEMYEKKIENITLKFLKIFLEIQIFLDDEYYNTNDAEDLLGELISLQNRKWYLYYLRGLIYYKKNYDWQLLAKDEFQKSINENPNFYKTYYYKALINNNEDNLSFNEINSIFQDLDKTIELNPLFENAYANLASAINRFKRYENPKLNELKTFENCNNAIFINENYDYPYYLRSILFLKSNNLIQAKHDIDKAIEINGNEINYFVHRAELYIQKNELISALKDYDKACYLDANSMNYWGNRVEIIKILKERNQFNQNLVEKFENWKKIIFG